ncbi:MAG: hypothetical protein UY35_C0007G0029 [Candidatus Saccharibacteria bacterium GW2011_GWC2_48_9]|nr:MAG: hypothetical protein UY35_C0007G0029 [Candidatus Saccharibacteria bacterium GW2011_GWC2_48_9]
MNKRKIVAIAIILVAIAGVAVILYIIKNERPGGNNPGAYYGQTADGFSASVDADKHLGTVDVVSVEDVAKAFGSDAKVSVPDESGTVNLGTTKSETATFAVETPKGKVEIEVDIRMYQTESDLNRANPFSGAERADVDEVGEEAHYFVPFQQEFLPEQQVALLTTQGQTSYKFALVQPSDSLIYTTDEAKAIVLAIAKQANLSAVK